MKKYFFIAFIALFLSFPLLLLSQKVSVSGNIDKNVINIGEQSKLKLSVSVPSNARIQWPELGDTIIREIEIVDKGKVDTTVSGGMNNYVQTLTVTSFDSGYYSIPPFVFHVTFANGKDTVVTTNGIMYEVHTVTIDTTGDIKDIRPVAQVPVTFREIIPYILLSVLLVAIVIGIYFLVIYYKKKKKSQGGLFRPKVVIPPHRKALDDLYALEKQKLWQCGEVKEYYFNITSILREYIANQFGIDAIEMVTDDIFKELNRIGKCQSQDIKIANDIFVLSDFVKFAKHLPEPEENGKVLEDAYAFVNNSYKYFVDLKKREEEIQNQKLNSQGNTNNKQ